MSIGRPVARVVDHTRFDELQEAIVADYRAGKGCTRLAVAYGVEEGVLRARLRKMGVLDPQRRPARVYTSSGERSSLRASSNFPPKVKRKRFQEEQGRCQLCGELIGDAWQQAEFHHVVPVADGGDRSPENCMVLHPECHAGSFEVLHNGRKARFIQDYHRCSCCGRRKVGVPEGGTCRSCLSPRKMWDRTRDTELLLRVKEGGTTTALASYFEVPSYLITKQLRRLGIPSAAPLPVDRALLTKLHAEGHTLKAVATLMGRDRANLCRVATDMGLDFKIKPWVWDTEKDDEVLRLHNEGHSAYRIAKLLGVTASGVRYHLRRIVGKTSNHED